MLIRENILQNQFCKGQAAGFRFPFVTVINSCVLFSLSLLLIVQHNTYKLQEYVLGNAFGAWQR